ncbi:MAG: nucleoside recognition protein [Deltaproteobacteria bacterium]|nr:nucleoside recognition protein [Candidatus Anaeroferrophillus wilburensis]MBN2888691.1 nucleoside recognition protein [Deltaproteobacteria bacterium]
MTVAEIIYEGLLGSLKQVWQIALIVVPLMVGMQILEDLQILHRVAVRLEKVVRYIGLSGRGAFPLVVGLVFGLAYGAGLIIHSARRGQLGKDELILIMTFLSINHAVFEDTLLFVAIGANGPLLLVIRFIISLAVTALLAGFFRWRRRELIAGDE